MNLAEALSFYLNLNLLVLIGYVGLCSIAFLFKLAKNSFSSRAELRLHYTVLIMVLVIAALHPLLPANEIFKPAAKVWSAQSIKTFSQDYTQPDKGGYLAVPNGKGYTSVDADTIASVWVVLLVLLLIGGGISMLRDFHVLFKLRRKFVQCKSIIT